VGLGGRRTIAFFLVSKMSFVQWKVMSNIFVSAVFQVYRNRKWVKIMSDALIPGDIVSISKIQNCLFTLNSLCCAVIS
jgi:magnesium-transporting ATPase (P-type)